MKDKQIQDNIKKWVWQNAGVKIKGVMDTGKSLEVQTAQYSVWLPFDLSDKVIFNTKMTIEYKNIDDIILIVDNHQDIIKYYNYLKELK